MSKIERRYSYNVNNAEEYRAKKVTNSDSNSRDIRGYGAVFNKNSKIITEYVRDKGEYRTFNENINPKAFDKILSNPKDYDVILSVNHDFRELLARTASGTLKLSKDDKGLVYETSLPDTSRGNDALTMINRGDYYESSFQFIIPENGDTWVKDNETKMWTRTINEVETLIDVTIATYRGAYQNTDIQVVGDNKTVEYNEYKPEDIAVATQRLNELEKISETRIKPTVDDIEKKDDLLEINEDYLVEFENDNDKLKLLFLK